MNSVKNIARRFLSLSLSLILVLVMLPSMTFTASAAAISGLNDTSIGLETGGDATATAGGTSVTASVTGEGGTCASSKSGTLTITNTKAHTATLSFSYTVTLNDGTVSVAGTSVTAAGTFTRDIAAGSNIVINLASAKGASTTSINITNISLIADVQATVTYKVPVNGSYTVDGTAITSEKTVTKSSATATALVATPASGYRFYAWHNVTNDSYFGYTATYSANFDTNITVEPVFVPSDAPVFDVSGKTFVDLQEAITYATNNNKATIVLVSDGALSSGTYTIPNGKTLLIPFDANNTIYTTEPEVTSPSVARELPTDFRTLTMKNGAKIVVANGAKLCVPSKLSATGTNTTSYNGTPTGPHGRIDMNSGSTIEVQSGGGLYCYGYISGSGLVDAKSGATVWEAFQFRCWRGGTATSNMRNKTVFPMSQYYVQNIEAPLKLEQGATEKVYTSVNATGSAYPTSATFIGSGGMFNPSGTVTKSYNCDTDRLTVDVDGNLTLSSMSMSLSVVTLNTGDFVLPINSNITININSGTTTLNQDLAFLPGTQVNIASGASLNVGSNTEVYIYDKDQWGQYAAAGAQLVVVGYNTKYKGTAKRNNNSLVDSVFNVNGTINISGKLYTTSSGADIKSSGKTGRVVFNAAAPANTNTQQVTQSSSTVTYVDIPVTSAQLHNGDGSYTATAGTASGEFFTYSSKQNKWIKGEETVDTYTVTFKNASGAVIKTVDVEEGSTVPSAEVPTLPATANNNNGTHTTYAWNASVTAPITADTTFTQVGTTVNCTLTTTATTPSTCTQAGSKTETCSVCGYTKTTALPLAAHSYTSVVTAPTCTAGGYTTYTCTVCGDTYTADATPANGHTPAAAVRENETASGCTTDGSYDSVVYCSVCGELISRETITVPATGHDFGEWTVTTQPTCQTTGVETQVCSRCDATQTRELATIDHDYSVVETIEATPNEHGYTKHTCSMCGDSYTDNETPYASDDSALKATKLLTAKYENVYYTPESYAAMTAAAETEVQAGDNSQIEIDAATAVILTAISDLIPYIAIDVAAPNGTYSINLDGEDDHYGTTFGTEVTVSVTPNEGYTFLGWYDTVSRHYISDTTTYVFTAKTNLSLKAVLVKEQSASIFFDDGSGYVKKTVTKTVAQWTSLTTIEAMLPELPYTYLKTAIAWDYSNEEVLAKLRNGENVTITPVYEEAERETPDIPTAGEEPVINILYQYDSDNRVGSYTIAPAVPADCTVEEIGIAYYYEYSDADSFILSNFFLTNDNRLTTSKFTYNADDSYYVVNVKFAKWKQNNWCARGYIVYRNADGKLTTAYSEQVNVFDGFLQN